MTIHSAVIQKLLSTNAHLGRANAAQHFKIYTHGTRNSTRNAITVIDSDKTLICMRTACNFIANLVRLNGKFLFVNTNPLCDEIVEQMIKKVGIKNDSSWKLGGFLTNSWSPKKFRSRNKKLNFSDPQPPDCVVLMDRDRKSSVIHEATRLQIPIVGLVDPNMPLEIYNKITYPIPCNDSVQFVYLFCNLITKTILYEKKMAAATGQLAIKEEEDEDPKLTPAKMETGEEAETTENAKIDGADDVTRLHEIAKIDGADDVTRLHEIAKIDVADDVTSFLENSSLHFNEHVETETLSEEVPKGEGGLELEVAPGMNIATK